MRAKSSKEDFVYKRAIVNITLKLFFQFGTLGPDRCRRIGRALMIDIFEVTIKMCTYLETVS